MNKTGLFAAMAIFAIGFASCNKDTEPQLTSTVSVNTYSLVTSTGGTVVSPTKYTYIFDVYKGTGTMGTEALGTAGGNVSFRTDAMKYLNAYATVEGDESIYEFISMTAEDAGGTPTPVTSLNSLITYATNANNMRLLADLKDVLNVNPISYPTTREKSLYSFTQYKYGAYTVTTFWPDMLYTGTTITNYPGAEIPYNNDKIVYRVVMDLSTPNDYKADVYFYNAKFAEKAPSINFVLKNLSLKFSAVGFTIDGSNVDPVMIPENTPNTRFRFDNFTLMSNPLMSTMSCRYKVAGVYMGQAEGAFLFTTGNK